MSDLYTLDEALNYLNTGITPVNEGIVKDSTLVSAFLTITDSSTEIVL